jgi:hypothetical protein
VPRYTSINRLPVPLDSEPPNAVVATHPLVEAAERRMLLVEDSFSDIVRAKPNPSEGELAFSLDNLSFFSHMNGVWLSSMGNFFFFNGPVAIPGTTFLPIMSVPLAPHSIYRIEGYMVAESPTDDFQVTLTGDAVRIEGQLGYQLTPATVTWTISASSSAQLLSFFTLAVQTSADEEADQLVIWMRKTADAGADLTFFWADFITYRVGTWSGV